jgi:uncharacterized protein (DUF1778 family)
MRWLVIALALAACHKKADCPAAMEAASHAAWSYQAVHENSDEQWQRSIDRGKAKSDELRTAIDATESDCYTISVALQHPKETNVELLRLKAEAFRRAVRSLDNNPTLDPALKKAMQADEPAFDAAIDQVPNPPSSSGPLRPTAASTKALKTLEAAWCVLQTSFAAVHDDKLAKLTVARDAALAEADQLAARSRVDDDLWTDAQEFAKAIDAHEVAPPLTAPGRLATEPGFGSARAALAAANSACD